MAERIWNTACVMLLALCIAMCGFLPETARADEAEDSFDRGVELFNAKDYPGALAEFLAAYKAKPHHSVLFNIAQCYKMVDSGAEALHYYELYLEEGAYYITQSRKEMVEQEIEDLKAQLTPLELAVVPDGATVILDGKDIGTTPVETLYLDPGEHVLGLQMAGHKTHRESFVAKRGSPLVIEVALEAEVIAGQDTRPVEDTTEKQPKKSIPVPPAVDGKTAALVPWGAAVGTGSVMLASSAAAIVLGVMNVKHHEKYIDLRKEIADGTYAGEDPLGVCKDARDKGKALNAGVGVAIGLSAAAAVITAVLIPQAIPNEKVEVKTGTGIQISVAF